MTFITFNQSLILEVSYRSIPLQAFLDAHNTAAADAAITEVFRISSDCLQARQMSAEMFLLEGKVEEAVAETGRILKMDPGNVPALLLRAQGYFLLQVRRLAAAYEWGAVTVPLVIVAWACALIAAA